MSKCLEVWKIWYQFLKNIIEGFLKFCDFKLRNIVWYHTYWGPTIPPPYSSKCFHSSLPLRPTVHSMLVELRINQEFFRCRLGSLSLWNNYEDIVVGCALEQKRNAVPRPTCSWKSKWVGEPDYTGCWMQLLKETGYFLQSWCNVCGDLGWASAGNLLKYIWLCFDFLHIFLAQVVSGETVSSHCPRVF